jgi:lambda family phage portal protein
MLEYSQADVFATNTSMQRVRVPADQIIHIYLKERITQVRAASWFASVMVKLRMLDRYEEATAVAQRLAACKMGVLERTQDAVRYEGQGETPSGEIIEEVSPGFVAELPAGYSFKSFDPSHPAETYANFRKSMLRTIGGGLGMMYNTLAGDLESINYSSARFGKDQEIEVWRWLQRFFSEHVSQKVFNAASGVSVLSGSLPSGYVEQLEDIQQSATWRPRGFKYVDPIKDGQAAMALIDFGLHTRSRELEEQGLDIEEVFSELQREKELAEKYGLVFVSDPSRQPPVSTQDDPNTAPGDVSAGDSGAATEKPKTGGSNSP